MEHFKSIDDNGNYGYSFSNMFRFDIINYPVYLIIGQTLFGFVSESTNQAMWSITGNAALMKKTYVPKYIFTLSKVTSSFVNMVFSLGAMLIVFVICKVKPNVNMLFIPVILLQMYIFCTGLGMILAQGTVFLEIYSIFIRRYLQHGCTLPPFLSDTATTIVTSKNY